MGYPAPHQTQVCCSRLSNAFENDETETCLPNGTLPGLRKNFTNGDGESQLDVEMSP